jgi:hypothetical protein
MAISPNRLFAVLTPLVFAPLAGAISVLAAEHLPGLNIDSDQLQGIFIAGALIAFGKAGLWLKGWQDWEKRQAEVPEDVANDEALESSIDVAVDDPDSGYDPALADGDPEDFEGSENGFVAAMED